MKTTYWYWIWRTFLGPSRLRRKFVRTFLLSGLIPLVLMGIASVYLVNLTHSVDVADLEHTLARQVAQEIKGSLDTIKTSLTLSVTFDEFAPISFADQHAALADFIRGTDAVQEVSFICTTPALCSEGTQTARLIKDSEGDLAEGSLENQADAPAFQTAKGGGTYTSGVIFTEQGPRILIATPVVNQKGQIIAVLSGTINLGYLGSIVQKAVLGETGYVFVVDGTGQIIAHPDRTRTGEIVSTLPPTEPFVIAEGVPPKRFARVSVYDNLDGKAVSGVTTSIPELGWRIAAEWPQTETQALIRIILIQIGVFALVALLVLISIASYVELRLIQPIAKLRQGTSIIGGGNFEYRVDIKTGDEIEDLGKNLNKMAENLKGLDEIKELRLRTDLLSESLKREQDLSKLKDQFITTVSHQFNTPLSVINWTLESFDDPKLTKAKIKDNTSVIGKSARDIANIVSDLITLSDIGFRYQKAKVKMVDLRDLVQKSIDRFKDEANLKKIALSYVPGEETQKIEANEFTLAKAMDNLIDNALSYTNESGTVLVELKTDGTNAVLTVKDTGIGIPQEDQSSIFQQFFRAKNAVQKKNVGTGLGLFIVKTIIEGHGGKVWFESSEGKGSTFSASIPLTK